MKPPICEVCHARFSAKTGALVTCVGDEKSAAWDRRQAAGSFPGHPPNKGWFCPSHREEAERLAGLLTLRQVVASIGGKPIPSGASVAGAAATSPTVPETSVAASGEQAGEERRPTNDAARICDVCGITFEEDTAGLVRFAPTRAGTEWHQAMIEGRASGTNPDHAWLCARHVTPALWISRTLNRRDAMAELMPAGRAPLEYDERPVSADAAEQDFPRRTSFLPVANDGLAETPERWVDIAPHPPKDVFAAVHSVRQQFGESFGVSALRNSGSIGSESSDPADVRWSAEGEWVGSTVAPHQAGDVVVFVIRQTFRSGDRRGPIVRQGVRVLIQQRERSMFELTFVPAEPPTVAADGLVMIERILVRRDPGMTEETSDRLDAVLGELSDLLSIEGEDPLTLVPDLVDVDLGSGVVVRKHFGDGSTVDWGDVAPTFDEALSMLFSSLPVLFAALDLGAVPDLAYSVERKWDPMDGAQPPHCPFSETKEWRGDGPGFDVNISHRSAHWNEDEIANQSGSLLIRADRSVGPVQASIWERRDGSGVALSLQRPTSAIVVAALRSHLDD